jgi:membrane protease YdiL (CAAX protease family)
MKKFFEKNEMFISIFMIVVYLVLNSFCLDKFGMYSWQTMLANIILSLIIAIFIFVLKLGDYFNLTRIPNFKKFLYFIPLFLLMSINLWGGIRLENSFSEIIFYMLSMLFVGFLEEIIFRGFLFKMMAKDSLKSAIVVTTLTFGIGHIINLLNGADVLPTLLQIMYATATGYLFVIIVIKGKSLWPCIITHSVVNALSVFAVNNLFTSVVSPIVLTIIPIAYAIYLNKRIN